MRDVAIVAFAQTPSVRREDRDETELVLQVATEALSEAGLRKGEVDFTIGGSCDFLLGRPFSWVGVIDALGAWPPIRETHVEMDGAWALYEAWIRLQQGDIDTALVYAFGRSSLGDLPRILTMQLDPYLVAPLWPDAVSLAAMQARVLLDRGIATERDFAAIAVRNRRSARSNPNAQVKGDGDVEALLSEPYCAAPLRKHDLPPISDAAAVIVLAAGDRARSLCARPVWIRGIDHRMETQSLGARDLAVSRSTELAAEKLNVRAFQPEVAELHAPYSFQETILREAIGLDAALPMNPSGGALAANPMMVAGLLRLGEAARSISDGAYRRAVAHATSGPCLQQNLLCLLEGA